MSIGILGKGWVTPLGRGLTEVSSAIKRGTLPPIHLLKNPKTEISYETFHVSPELTKDTELLPRLRRSSVISHFSLIAVMDALRDSGMTRHDLVGKSTAVVFCTSSGGVNYTCRFYAEVAAGQQGSPLLFPETVYNAPASHIAAWLETDGPSLSLVGDATAASSALKQAAEMLESGEADFVFVVSAEEADWITCEAYGIWKLVKQTGNAEGSYFSEGAAAVLLSRSAGMCRIQNVHPGRNWKSFRDLPHVLSTVLQETSARQNKPDLIVNSASGTRFDAIEKTILNTLWPQVPQESPSMILGQSLTVSGIQQVIIAALALEEKPTGSVLVSLPGFNGMASGVFLTGTAV